MLLLAPCGRSAAIKTDNYLYSKYTEVKTITRICSIAIAIEWPKTRRRAFCPKKNSEIQTS